MKFAASLHCPVSTPNGMLSENTARRGDEGKAVERRGALTALLFEQSAISSRFVSIIGRPGEFLFDLNFVF